MHREILRIAIPSIVTNITVPLLGMVDIAITGHIGSATAIGAISVGGLIFNMVYWLFNFLRMGTSGLTAQAYGQGDVDAQRRTLRIALLVAVVSGVLIFAAQRPIEWVAHIIIEPTDQVWQMAISYFRIRIWAAPAVLALFSLNGWFVGMQNSRFPMYIAIGQNLLNIGLSALLVFHYEMGIEGVALGTVCAQYAGLAAALLFVSHTRYNTERVADTKPYSLRSSLRVYTHILLRMVCLIAVTTAFTSFGARQGDLLLAVNTLLIQLFILFSYFCDGFALAGEALVGKYVGAGDPVRQRRCIAQLFLWSGGVTLLFTALYAAFGTNLLGLLTNDAEVVSAATPYFYWILLVPISGFAAFMWDGIYIGATATRQMLYTLVISATLFFVVWFLPLPLGTNHHLWLAFVLYLATRSIYQTILAPKALR
ncbi:MAG: MATE family efflux transporter [Bacteroidales bacterium]|nr:MATE family efflux transporter [Bacteroidales bacterium]